MFARSASGHEPSQLFNDTLSVPDTLIGRDVASTGGASLSFAPENRDEQSHISFSWPNIGSSSKSISQLRTVFKARMFDGTEWLISRLSPESALVRHCDACDEKFYDGINKRRFADRHPVPCR